MGGTYFITSVLSPHHVYSYSSDPTVGHLPAPTFDKVQDLVHQRACVQLSCSVVCACGAGMS